jgi:hypothetical protein
MVEVTTQLPHKVPEYCVVEDINFHLNESSWCYNNIVDDLEPADGYCLCPCSSGKYLREADEKDKRIWADSNAMILVDEPASPTNE